MHTFLGLGKLRLIGIISLLVLIPIGCNASNCPELYPNSQPITVANTVELCNTFYVSLYDKQKQKVILVSEHLKHDGVGDAIRDNEFHSDPRIGFKPNPSQYANTGYDRGHMAPAGDAANAKEMHETFLMTNMTPQVPSLNRESWRALEERVRKIFSETKSDMYVITIAVYADNKVMNGIPVPTAYWKVVMANSLAKYYYAINTSNSKVTENAPVPLSSLLPK
jgi:endonuclease G, mitochondrial